MILEQIKGPFAKNQKHEFGGTDGRAYIRIGIQIPDRQPIGYSEKRAYSEKKKGIPSIEGNPDIDVTIKLNDAEHSFSVNECGLLELDGNFGNMVTITFERNLPEGSIIDALYKEAGE